MSAQTNSNPGAIRDKARVRLRTLTNAALLAATGATVGIGIVVAQEHPGKSASGSTTSGGSTGSTAGTGTTGSSGNTGDDTGSSSSGNTGNSGASSFSPSSSSQTPSVTSGGSTARR